MVAEELGRAAAPGPWATTAVVGAVVAECGARPWPRRSCPGWPTGPSRPHWRFPPAAPDGAAVAPGGLSGRPGPDGSVTVDGSIGPIPNGAVAAAGAGPGGRGRARRVGPARAGRCPGVEVTVPSFDPTRRSAALDARRRRRAGGAGARPVPPTGRIRDLALVVASAEAVGGARWCLDTAAEHARTRQQFGRPIGQFQGVKHRLADMLVSVEQAVAATWDAAMVVGPGRAAWWPPGGRPRPTGSRQVRLAVQLAAALALDGYVEAAKGAIQVLGGMGFTWEHDAHIHLRRATTLRQLVGGTAPLRAEAARLALDGPAAPTGDRPPARGGGAAPGAGARGGRASPPSTTRPTQRRALADAGLLAPHWPAPGAGTPGRSSSW